MSSFNYLYPRFRQLAFNSAGIDEALMLSCIRETARHYPDSSSDTLAVRAVDMYSQLVRLAQLDDGKLSKEVLRGTDQKQ